MNASTLQPWARGDLFVAVTELNDPADDHAGRGRILQYGADLHPKGVLELERHEPPGRRAEVRSATACSGPSTARVSWC